MKEEILIHNKNKKMNPKGSVLFTVVAVMMVMIVFVLATLTIAGAANKRAYASYSKNQTTYTAQAALDATIQAMCEDTNIANTVAGGSGTLDITLPDASMGTATVTINKAGQVEQLNTVTGNNEKLDVISLTATAVLGDETSTVSNYFVLNPVEEPDSPSNISKALTVLGDINNGDGINAFGGASVGVSKDSTRWAKGLNAQGIPNDSASESSEYNVFTNNNPRPSTGNFTINGSYDVSSSASAALKLSNGQGFSIFGDLLSGDQPLWIDSVVNVSNVSTYDDIPYIYVERSFQKLVFNSSYSNSNMVGSSQYPIVVYCGGNIDLDTATKGVSFASDIYVYNHDFSLDKADYSDFDENTHNFNSDMLDVVVSKTNLNVTVSKKSCSEYGVSKVGNQNTTELLKWAASVVNGSSGTSVGGNFYTKGSLILKETSMAGDCYVGDDLQVNGNVTIEGTLTVTNQAYITQNMTVGYLDVKPENLKVENYVSINGINYGEFKNDDTEYKNAYAKNVDFITAVNGAVITYDYNYVGTGGNYILDKNQDGTPKYYNVGSGNGKYAQKYTLDNSNGTWVYGPNPYYPPQTIWYEVGTKSSPNIYIPNYTSYLSYDHYIYEGIQKVEDGTGDYDVKYIPVEDGTGDYEQVKSVNGGSSAKSVSFPTSKSLTNVLNMIDTPQDILNEYAESDGSGYKESEYPTTNPNATACASKVYTSYCSAILNSSYGVNADVLKNGSLITPNSDGYYEISEDCTLSGSFEKTQILFKPGTGTIWVQLENGFKDGNGFEFVIDDSQGGSVNFYIPDNSSVSLGNNSKIWTKAYKTLLENNGKVSINFYETTTDADGNETLVLDSDGNPKVAKTVPYDNLTLYGTMPKFSDFTNYIPGVNIYSGKTGASLSLGNSSFLTGYILAPYLSGSMGTSGTSYKISYADNIDSSLATFDNVDPQVIGAVVVGSGFSTVNARTYIFVSKDSSSTNTGTKTMANGDSIKMYQSTYQNSY